MILLDVKNLTKSFGGVRAVVDVNFQIGVGELLAMIGPNGAGKSTCFNMLNGQLKPDSGQIFFRGENITGLPPKKIYQCGIGRTFQIAETYASLTVRENVQMALIAHARHVFRFTGNATNYQKTKALDILEQVGMSEQSERSCGMLAYGDIKRVELAMALASNPTLLLMDEPTAGMGAKERNGLMALTKRLVQERAMSVLFTEHSMDVIFGYADRLIVLAQGRLIADGAPQTVRNDSIVRAAYFGGGRSVAGHEARAE